MHMLRSNPKIIVATKNKGKVKEFARHFGKLGIEVSSLLEYPEVPDIVEDGKTFEQNAEIKARAIASRFSLPVLADDSGLCVDALAGTPGVYSARYAGEGATDADNNHKLLKELQADRTDSPYLSKARFVCSLVLFEPDTGKTLKAEGEVEGLILRKPQGEGGFGYDSLFYLPQFGKTMAELTVEEKNEISHRGQALGKLISFL
jgi:XTP/dITP diphosphohydrolase